MTLWHGAPQCLNPALKTSENLTGPQTAVICVGCTNAPRKLFKSELYKCIHSHAEQFKRDLAVKLHLKTPVINYTRITFLVQFHASCM